MADDWNHLPPDEHELVQLVLDHYRHDKAKGEPWFQLEPLSTNLHRMAPIPCPTASPLPARVIEVHVRPDQPQAARLTHDEAATQDAAPDSPLNPTEEEILAVLAASPVPLKSSTIAVKAKLKLNSYFRQCLQDLVHKKRVVRIGDNHYGLAT